MKKNIFTVSLLIILAAISRFIPHGYNFTPIAGMALLGAAYFNKKHLAYLVPIMTLVLSDIILNNTLYRAFYPDHEGFVLLTDFMLYTYAGMALIVLIGQGLLKKVSAPRILGSAISGTIAFFLITNFGTWMHSGMYPSNIAGLGAAYVAGLPFMSGHLLGISYSVLPYSLFMN